MFRKTTILALALISVLIVPGVVMAQTSSDLEVVLTKQTPYPAEPGGTLDVEIEIQNNGYADANNYIVQIVPESPFTLVTGQDATKSFSRISALDSVKATFKLTVSDTAISNSYDLKFRLYPQSSPTIYLEKSVSIDVQGSTDFVIDSITTVPENIEPGGRVDLHVNIKNTGTGTARRVQGSFAAESTSIVPILSGGLVYVGDVAPDETKDVKLTIGIGPDLDYGVYSSTLTLSYKDENNAQQTQSFDLGIPVTGVILMDIISIEPDYTGGTLDIEVANKGTADASSVEAKLFIGGEDTGIDYLSQLKATKKTTFSFPLVMQGAGELVIDYVGPDLKEGQIRKDVVLNFETPGGDTSGISILFWLIIIAVIGFFVWRRYFRKKKKSR
jgi:hypothetical protein